jgi:hypothetical protein
MSETPNEYYRNQKETELKCHRCRLTFQFCDCKIIVDSHGEITYRKEFAKTPIYPSLNPNYPTIQAQVDRLYAGAMCIRNEIVMRGHTMPLAELERLNFEAKCLEQVAKLIGRFE